MYLLCLNKKTTKLLSSVCFISGILFMPLYSYATTCTGGVVCEVNLTTDTIASAQNEGSHLIYNESVVITTYGQYTNGLQAKNASQITFKKNVAFNTDMPVSTIYWFNVTQGSTVTVDGNMSISASSTFSNPVVMIDGKTSSLSIAGDFNVTINKTPSNVNAATISPIFLNKGNLTVGGIASINAQYMSTGGTALTSAGGVAKFNELHIVTNGARAMHSSVGGYISSTGATDIVSNNSTAVWIGDKSFISIGESEEETNNLASSWNNNAILNVGAKANITGYDYGIKVLSGSPESYVYVRGTVTGNIAISGYDNPNSREIIVVQGGTVNGKVDLLRGDDEYRLESGNQIGDIDMGGGNDKLSILGGLLKGTVYMNTGDDTVELSGGGVNGIINMGTGHNKGLITGSFDTTGFTRFDGGSNGISSDNTALLTIDHYLLSAYTNVPRDLNDKGLNLTNWTEVNVQNGSVLTLTDTAFFYRMRDPEVINQLNIDATSTVVGAADVTDQIIMADVNNSGFLRLDGNATAGDRWEIRGNYVGNNGNIVLDTKLGDDTSPTDFLHITGNASGTTGVQVINRNGLGALTTGDGIQLIQVDGISDKSNFALKSDYSFELQAAVIGGAYAYSLYAGNQAGTFAGDWYLRSMTTDKPVYAATVPMYEVYPQLLQQLNKLGTLEQRVGNRVWLGSATDAQTAVMNEIDGRGFWMKVEGSTGHINPNVSKTKSDYDLDMIKTQLGLDFVASENDKGKLVGGVYFQYGHAKADVSSRYGEGNIKTDGYGLGGTLTWYGANDVYVDGVAQVMWYDSDIRSDWLTNRDLVNGNDGTGYALSIETGKKIQLNHEWTMTPQAQLSYNAIDFDSFHDGYGGRVSREDGDALTGRLGIAFNRERAWKSEQGDTRRLKTYGIGNLYYEFLNGTEVSVTQVDFRNRSDRFWGGIGGGLSYNWKDDAYSIYGEVDGRTSFSDFGDSYSLNGTIGFRAKF